MTRYVALVDGEAGAYGVTVPDLPGCTSAGARNDEALRNAIEAVRLWAEDAIADGEELPKPRSAETLRADPAVAQAITEGAALAMRRLRLCLCFSTQVARPRPTFRSTPGCSRP